MKIYPSLISCDLLNLAPTLSVLDNHCNGYHLDVMDDHFVPNLTWGPAFINAIRKASSRPLQIHLMVDNPTSWLERLELHAGDSFIFHHEALPNHKAQTALIEQIHNKGWLAGIAVNPQTAIDDIFETISLLDEVLLMSVEPGFSGQHFIPEVMTKIQPLLAMKAQLNTMFSIGMDGGVNEQNIADLAHNHIDFVAAAAAIFHRHDSIAALQTLHALTKKL